MDEVLGEEAARELWGGRFAAGALSQEAGDALEGRVLGHVQWGGARGGGAEVWVADALRAAEVSEQSVAREGSDGVTGSVCRSSQLTR